MRLKSFQAKSMSDAMRQVKDALGDDAIIVTTKETPGGWVRITAAVEQTNPVPAAPEEESFDADAIGEQITDVLLKHRVPGAVSDKILSACLPLGGMDAQKVLAKALQKTFEFKKTAPAKSIILVGPPGAGKTLMTAKLAARAVLDGKKPFVITTDIARAGGIEQLQAFLDILSLPLQQAADPKTLKAALAKASKSAQIIVDTGGLNPFDPQEMKQLARLLAVEEMEAALVLPTGIDAEESAEMALTFGVLGVKSVIPTRLDFARRIGGILNAADKAGLSFTEGSHTPQVADGLVSLTPETLAEMLLPRARKKK